MRGLMYPWRKGRHFGGCGIAGFINLDGRREDGGRIRQMIELMRERESGMGARFAVYESFPGYEDYYCLQILLDNMDAKKRLQNYLQEHVEVEEEKKIPTQNVETIKPPYPIPWRFFVAPPDDSNAEMSEGPDQYMVKIILSINEEVPGAFCMSGGKNMGIFKGNGWSHEIARFYDITRYKGSMWIGLARFPTNAPGWWGGAHPFNILDWAVSHNGEITSYGTNKRYVEMHGYRCSLLTDSEVVSYLLDLLVRKHEIPIPLVATILSPPHYGKLVDSPPEKRRFLKILRSTYGRAMINGPMSIVAGRMDPEPVLIGLTDRKKLRPLSAGITEDDKTVFMASEEKSIRWASNQAVEVCLPKAGNPVIARRGEEFVWDGTKEPLEALDIRLHDSISGPGLGG